MAIFEKKQDKEDNKTNSSKSDVKIKENTGNAYRVLVRPLVSEKSYKAAGMGKYAFVVFKDANKLEIRKAVEKVYDVKVLTVNVLNVRGKHRNYGKTQGSTSAWKKAIVTLK